MTGLQVARGEPGMVLLGVALLGALATLFSKAMGGFMDLAGGAIVLLETRGEMSNLSSIAEEATTSYVRADLGSGGYLAVVSSVLVIFAGIITVLKLESDRSRKTATKEGVSAHAKPRTGLRGPFLLNEHTINEEAAKKSPGVYALGYKRERTFYVRCIGRSDTDVNARLKEHIGKYDSFKFEYYDSPEAAFVKECELYHAFNGPKGRLDNGHHPEKSAGTTWQCPKCNVVSSQVAAPTMQQPQPESQLAIEPKNQFCVNCGSRIPLGSKFCPSCRTQQSAQILS